MQLTGFRPGFPKRVRELIKEGQRGYCYLCDRKIVDIHHRVPNTKTNEKVFPLFLQSIFNGVGLCRECHEKRTKDVRITHDMAKVYEFRSSIYNDEGEVVDEVQRDIQI